MSHFVVTVAMEPTDNVETKLAEIFHPFDENREDIPEYRAYEDCGAAVNYWLYTSLARTTEEVAVNDKSSIRPYRPDEIGWSSAFDTKRTEDEQWADMVKEAEKFKEFSNPPTWPEVIKYANNRWYPEGETEDNRQDILRYDAEKDQAYHYSTYNPDSKWDWYQIGGRWSDYFPYRSDIEFGDYSSLISGTRSWASPDTKGLSYCDGGPVGLLDLERLRSEKGTEAGKRYDAYHSLVEGLPEALPWRVFSEDAQGRVNLLKNRQAITSVWDEAREAFGQQPRVAVVRESDEFRFSFGCLITEFSVSRESYVETARNEAVPGYALITTEGEWMAPGTMGMFGFSSASGEDTVMFKAKANEYIDGLSPDTLLITVDCHI